MKQKKRSGLSRIGAMLLVFILAINLIVPSLAASGVVLDDTKAIETGILKYDYDQIPEYMLEDNLALDALEYIGYDVQALKDNKVLYHPDYVGLHLASSQYLLQEDPILTYIKYSDSGAPGASEKRAETPEELAATQTGWVPDVDRFKYGNSNWKPGMSCTSFVEYFVFGYLKHIVGKDVKYIEQAYNTAHANIQNKTSKYPDTWTEMCEGTGKLIANGKVTHYSIDLESSKDQTAEYNAIWRKIGPGTIIRFGNDTSPYIHYAVYLGTYNNLHYVAQVGGGDRGPEIFIAEQMAYRNDGKTSFPIDFYDFKFKDPYGAIQVVKSDADDDSKLAGAIFKVVNRTTQKVYTFGPTNEMGYAIVEYLPYNATSGTKYTVQEVVPPEGYALDPTVHTVTLSDDTPLITLYQEIVNEKAFGSLQIQKDTNTGNNKAGWQFNLYKNSPTYTTQLTTDNSGQMFRVTVSDSSGNSVTSNAVSMTTTPLKILKQPQSVKVALGDTARFNVTVQGDGLSYKWYYQNPGGSVNEAGSTAGKYTPYYNYTISDSEKSGRAMWCVITDKYGNSVTTEKAYLWLNTDPNAPSTLEAAASLITYGDTAADDAVTVASDTLAITKQPQNHVDEDGTFATFTVEAQGVGLTYVWETSTDGGKTWKRLTNPIKDSPYTTDAQGIVNISNLQTGDDFVQEINTGKDGWEYDLVAKPVTVTANHTATAPAVVRFTNNELTGGLLIVKTTEDRKYIAGWQFGLYSDASCDPQYQVGATATTTATGRLPFPNLTPGTYWVKELGHIDPAIDELYYCASENPQKVTVEAGKTATVRFENRLRTGTGKVVKITTNGGSAAGWQFHFWTDTADLGIYTTNGNGEIVLDNLLPGTVYVQEVGHETYDLRYWIMDAEIKEMTIEADKTSSVSFENVWMGELVIDKQAINSDLLAGWTGDLYLVNPDGSETKIGTYTSNESGRFTELLVAPGNYIFRETGHSDSSVDLTYWVMAGDKEIVVNAGATTPATIINTELGYGQIIKDTTNGGIKEGWLFEVKDAAGNPLTGSPFTSGADGKIDLDLLPPGEYTVQEIGHNSMTPEQLAYWVMDTEVKTLVVEAGSTASVRFENQWKGMGRIKKEMPDGGSVAGWTFDVYRVSDNAYIGEFTSEENGDIALGYLIPGDYRVVERIPEGSLYLPVGGNEKILTVVAGEVKSVTFRNVLRSGEIIVNKADGNNGAALAGAKFLLEWLDNDVWKPVVLSDTIIPGGCRSEGLENGCLVTGEDGRIVFEGLHPDLEYRLTEIEAPNGYALQSAPVFEGKLPVDALSAEVDVLNYGIIELPPTGIDAHLTGLTVFTAIVVCLFFAMVALAIKEGMLTEFIRKHRK